MNRLACLLVLLFAVRLEAAVSRVEVIAREDLLGGKQFGLAGAYEKITAKVHFALDPANAHNRAIVDLDKAQRNDKGLVELWADAVIVRPKDRTKGNGALVLDVPNRGGTLSFRGTAKEGEIDEWFLRQGYTLASLGWQFDVKPGPNLLHLEAPKAVGVTGRVRSDFAVVERTGEHSVSHIIQDTVGGIGYPAADLKAADAILTERDSPTGDRREVPRKRWHFSDRFTLQADDGFSPGKIYEVIYTATDAVVVGAGLAAVRDFADFCKNDANAVAPANRVYGFGISQTGRFLRHFVYQGFNASESGQKVFDGLLVYVAGAGRGGFNHRFAQPSRDSQTLSPLFYPNDLFPFTDWPTVDPVSGKREGLLDKARALNVIPKIFYINTAYEYWSRGASLLHTTPDGASDVALPPDTRLYFIAGVSHVPGPFPPGHRQVREILGQNLENPNSYNLHRRAFLAAMDAWVSNGVAPPESRYPTLADHTLVPLKDMVRVKGIDLPEPYGVYKLQVGAEWPKGITTEPPKVTGSYPSLLPQVKPDGNDLAGVRRPELEAPLAVYTGWNPRDAKVGFPGLRNSFIGSYFGFPREQVLAKYRTADEYVGAYGTAAAALVKQRFLVADDLPGLLETAAKEWQYAAQGDTTASRK